MLVLIAEDERLAREELIYLLEQEKDIQLLPSATNGRELLELVETYNPQVIFLDIQMPELEGLQAARMLTAKEHRPLIVFTTAHEKYALEAFGIGAVDYLLKPYDYVRLKETLQRLRQRILNSEAEMPSSETTQKKLLIDDGASLVVIDPNKIMYAAREDRTIKIQTTNNKIYYSKMTLQQLEEKLLPYSFFRTHRSYLVNLNYVLELVPWFNGAYNLILTDEKKTQIPVSRSSVKELLNKYN